jgi:hypothetical protein
VITDKSGSELVRFSQLQQSDPDNGQSLAGLGEALSNIANQTFNTQFKLYNDVSALVTFVATDATIA